MPDINERSGLIQRFNVYNFKSNLPKDPYRDNYYGTRFGNYGKVHDTNTYYDGGLYGVRLPGRDTASVYPFFYGSPGRSTITPESKSWRPGCLGALQQLTHQRKPVGMYTTEAVTSRSTTSIPSPPDPAPITGPGSSRAAEAAEPLPASQRAGSDSFRFVEHSTSRMSSARLNIPDPGAA